MLMVLEVHSGRYRNYDLETSPGGRRELSGWRVLMPFNNISESSLGGLPSMMYRHTSSTIPRQVVLPSSSDFG